MIFTLGKSNSVLNSANINFNQVIDIWTNSVGKEHQSNKVVGKGEIAGGELTVCFWQSVTVDDSSRESDEAYIKVKAVLC